MRGTQSKQTAVISGVPQGTVLGPLLFLVYINDMPNETKSKIALFADDSYIYRRILSKEDSKQLQLDLDKLVTWEKNWSMQFHPEKCKLLRITNKRNVIKSDYTIHGQKLELVSKAKYLGVTLSKDISWKTHTSNICAKANNTRFFLQRNLAKSDPETRLMCYKIYIRPTLEYASSVWDPIGQETLKSKIEMVQRKSLRWIYNDWLQTTSPTALRELSKIETLQERRSTARIRMLHELYHGTKKANQNVIPSCQRCEKLKFNPILGRVQVYSYSFLPSTVELWNRLPSKIRTIKDKNEFQSELEKIEMKNF